MSDGYRFCLCGGNPSCFAHRLTPGQGRAFPADRDGEIDLVLSCVVSAGLLEAVPSWVAD